jgi:predicted outer membrane repeat protein
MDSMGTSRASAVSPVYELDLNKDYYVSFYFLIPDSGNHWFEVFNNHQIYLVIDSGTQLKCYLGNNNSLLVTDLSTDHWYHIEIITKPSSSNYDVYIDGVLKRTCPFWIHAGFEDRFQIGDRKGTSNDYGEAYWDDFLITQGTLIHVDCGATGNNDGTSWADAFTSLQDGLDRAVRGDRIWVAAGTYKPTSDYGLNIGDRGKHFRMINRVAIYGGFPATGDPGMDDRDPNNYETILSGDLAGNDEPFTDPLDLLDDPNRQENCLHVFYHPEGINLDPNAVLDGFTITGGNANEESLWDPNCSGGGMYNYISSPTVNHCTFTDNTSNTWGGGICIWYSSPIVARCVFTGNSTEYGGGMCNYNSSPTVTDCIFSGNTVVYYGGGMYDNRSSPGVTLCTFSGNSAGHYGGGICSNSDFCLNNCILWGNTASDGSQFYNEGTSSALVTYSDIQGGCTGVGNIDADPMFVDAIGGNLHLISWSPCINRGDPAGAYGGQVDIDGGPRVRYGRVDMGVDEMIPIAGDFDGDERVAGVDLIYFCSYWLQDPCSGLIGCGEVDIDASGKIDLIDYAIISRHWFMGY